jgi:hypothetical protein
MSTLCERGTGESAETLTHFARLCPKFREAKTSAHNQMRQAISSLLIPVVGPHWVVLQEFQMDITGLRLLLVWNIRIARDQQLQMAGPKQECHFARWQHEWILVSYLLIRSLLWIYAAHLMCIRIHYLRRLFGSRKDIARLWTPLKTIPARVGQCIVSLPGK